jgi:hypothetical protein
MESTKVSGPTLRQNEASDECFCLDPLVPDPYEHARVCVGSSRLCGTAREGSAAGNSAGQGLFLRQAVGPDELVSWYNGVKVAAQPVEHGRARRVIRAALNGGSWFRCRIVWWTGARGTSTTTPSAST